MSGDEVWRPYREFPFVEGSTLGNVRTTDRYINTKNGNRLIKGRILKQWYSRTGYLLVTFRVNGKLIRKQVHRIIAGCFLPNPDNLPQVNHKNCVRDDNVVTNLEWCSASYNSQYREKYGKATGRPVIAVNIKTLKVLRFSSRAAAAHSLGVYSTSVSAVIRGKLKQTGGFWFTEDESKINKDKLNKIKNSMQFVDGVVAINTATLEVLRFDSQKEAGHKVEARSQNINKVLKGSQNTAGGFWFTYANDHAVESVRKKFGDIVANKVAELVNEK